MNVAIIVEAAGSAHALAMTSFVGSLAEGFDEAGVPVRVIGLAESPAYWLPETLGPVANGAPWLHPAAARLRDLGEAIRLGVLDPLETASGTAAHATRDWYLELLLQRDVGAFSHGDPDTVLLVYPRSIALLAPVVRVAARLQLKVVAFATESLTDAQIDPATRAEYIRCVVQCCDGVWAVSGYLASAWQGYGVPADRIHVSPPAVRRANLVAADSAVAGAHRAVFMGNLVHRDVDYLIDIAERVAAEVSGFRLTIFGDASEQQRAALKSRIDQRGLASVVTVESPVSPLHAPGVLAVADVLVLPRASGEYSAAGFPRKLSEYLASGRPVVVTAVGDIPAYLVDGRDALLVPPDDCDAFAAALIRVLRDPELGRRLGTAGRSLAAEAFLAGHIAAQGGAFLARLDRRPLSIVRPSPRVLVMRVRAVAPGVVRSLKRAAVRVLRALHLKRTPG